MSTFRHRVRLCVMGMILFYAALVLMISQMKSTYQSHSLNQRSLKMALEDRARIFSNEAKNPLESLDVKVYQKRMQHYLEESQRFSLSPTTPSYDRTWYNVTSQFDCSPGFIERFHIDSKKLKHETYTWKEVVFSDRPKAYLYSAYYETRSRPGSVVVMAISTGGRSEPEYCRMWLKNEDTGKESSIITRAWLRYVPEDYDRRYAAAFYTCYVPDGLIPEVVSIVTERCQSPLNLLKVVQTSTYSPDQLKHISKIEQLSDSNVHNPAQVKKDSQITNDDTSNSDSLIYTKSFVNFTVCVPPLNFKYNNVHQLVEMIETNRMFGAQRFVFYNYSIGPDVERYLQSYISDGLVEIMPWQIPIQVDSQTPKNPSVAPEIHYFGQLAALNDCLYRSSKSTKYIVFTDLDEILVPRLRTNWQELLNDLHVTWAKESQLSKTKLKLPGAYIVRNVFFRHDWGNDTKVEKDELVQRLRLRTQLHTVREANIHQHYQRSKYIVEPRLVHMVGIHQVIRFVDDRVTNVLVDVKDALIHHYRPSMWADDPINPPGRTHDRRMHAFLDEIVSRTLARHRLVERQLKIRP